MTKKIEKKVIINVRNGKLWKKDFLKRLRRVESGRWKVEGGTGRLRREDRGSGMGAL
jgi:hypothetical protein